MVAPGLRVGRGLELGRGNLYLVAGLMLRPASGSGEDWNMACKGLVYGPQSLRPASGSGEDWNLQYMFTSSPM